MCLLHGNKLTGTAEQASWLHRQQLCVAQQRIHRAESNTQFASAPSNTTLGSIGSSARTPSLHALQHGGSVAPRMLQRLQLTHRVTW
jgi:hypothetical protein